MKKEKADFSITKEHVPDSVLESSAQEILDNLRTSFNSPQHAMQVLVLVHLGLLRMSFPPGYKDKAIKSVDAHAAWLKEHLKAGWS